MQFQSLSPVAKKTILIVEDDESIRRTFAIALKRDGYMIIAVQDGTKALNALRMITPDLILLDLVMPTMNGLDFLALQRNDSFCRNIPTIVVSAADELRDLESSAGVCAFIPKPLLLHELIDNVRKFCA